MLCHRDIFQVISFQGRLHIGISSTINIFFAMEDNMDSLMRRVFWLITGSTGERKGGK